LGDFSVCFNKDFEKQPKLKTTVELQNGLDVFRFLKNNLTTYSGDEFVPHKQLNDSTGKPFYLHNFEMLFLRSNYVELEKEVLRTLVNVVVSIKILMLNEVTVAAPAKGAKGAPAAPPTPSEELLIEYRIPFRQILTAAGGILDITESLAHVSVPFIVHEYIEKENSIFALKFLLDDDLASFVLGARILYYEQGILQSPPHTWALHAPDVIDPKAKIQPTALDLRNKYLENISKCIDSQGKIAQYKLLIGVSKEDSNSTVNKIEETRDLEMSLIDYMKTKFPVIELSNGMIHFHREAALEVPIEENIRETPHLWSGKRN
jgi:hypothetical protein